MKILKNFNQLSFHDASVESVKREGDCIEINFDFVIVTPEHPLANGNIIELKNAQVVFKKVKSENALIWHNDKSPISHPNPSAPIDEVMHGKHKNGLFHFDGFWQVDDWSEWYIYSENFEVTGEPIEFPRARY
ncbi:MAG: hypothetical protein MJK10_01355 [Pseudomonadales bacterium]|nr:hypothetical protein [Pseudomonadales bacterium]NRA14523.1 hypothetical protein [Oceanospirillaceae bacterium]